MNRPFVHFIGNLEELKNKKYTELPRKPSVQSPVEIKTSKYKLLFCQNFRYIFYVYIKKHIIILRKNLKYILKV